VGIGLGLGAVKLILLPSYTNKPEEDLKN